MKRDFLLTLLFIAVGILLIAALYWSSPEIALPECRGADTPRHCVD